MTVKLYEVELGTEHQDGILIQVYCANSTEAISKAIKIVKKEIHCVSLIQMPMMGENEGDMIQPEQPWERK